MRGTIAASHKGFPALRRLLDNDLTPLLSRLGGNFQGHSPWLAEFNPIIKVAQQYRHEITAFLGNIAAATNGFQTAPEKNFNPVKLLRTTSPLNPQSVAAFPQRLTMERANPYFKPGGYKNLRHGLQSFANTPCSAGIRRSSTRTRRTTPTSGTAAASRGPRRRRRRRHRTCSTASSPSPSTTS